MRQPPELVVALRRIGGENEPFATHRLQWTPVSLALTGVLLQKAGPTATVLLVAGSFALLALLATLNPHLCRENASLLWGKPLSPASASSNRRSRRANEDGKEN